MSTLSIPASVADITPGWLTAVLQESEAIPSTARATILWPTQIGQGIGIMGDIHRVEIGYENPPQAGPASVVVKLPSSFEANREQGVNLGMYEAEVRFYDELAPETGAGLPVIHLAKIEPGTADFVIVMEDLSHLELVRQDQGLSPEQALAAVRVLADVHAAWWDRVQTKELDWIPSMIGGRVEMVDQLLGQVWPVFLERFEDRLPDGGAAVGERFSHSYLRLQRVLGARSPWTLAHQDFRSENLLFGDPAADEVVVIDWQGIGRGPGMYDVAYVLGGSMPIESRREHESDLVAAYHARLMENKVTKYTLEQARTDYEFAHFLGGLATSVFAGATLDLANADGYELVATMANRHFTAALDHGGLESMD